MENSDKNHNCSSCHCVCHKMNGIVLILIGLTFLLGAFEVVSQHVVNVTWPVLLILMGLKNSMGKGRCNCCEKS